MTSRSIQILGRWSTLRPLTYVQNPSFRRYSSSPDSPPPDTTLPDAFSPVPSAPKTSPRPLPKTDKPSLGAPPFTPATALNKVQTAQKLWNTQDPVQVAQAYTEDCIWRNRDEFLQGRPAIEAFLRRKWAKEKHYRLRKELFCYYGNKIAVQFWYEWQDASSQWWRTYGLEHWTFNKSGLMQERRMSGNDVKITAEERWFKGMELNKGPDPEPQQQ